jgi:SEC-C motif domain protein
MIPNACPCQSKKQYADCCGPYIQGNLPAPTPEALMRSRYSAYTQADTDYIKNTMTGCAARGFVPRDAKIWAEQAQWLGLNVINTQKGQNEHHGFVEFAARIKNADGIHFIHEISEFKKTDDAWFYVDGKTQKMPARNAPCLCGSGKKYKRCCI